MGEGQSSPTFFLGNDSFLRAIGMKDSILTLTYEVGQPLTPDQAEEIRHLDTLCVLLADSVKALLHRAEVAEAAAEERL